MRKTSVNRCLGWANAHSITEMRRPCAWRPYMWAVSGQPPGVRQELAALEVTVVQLVQPALDLYRDLVRPDKQLGGVSATGEFADDAGLDRIARQERLRSLAR